MREYWLNLYPSGVGRPYLTRPSADAMAGSFRIARIRVRLK